VADIVDLATLDLDAAQRLRVGRVLVVRHGLHGEEVADAEPLDEWLPIIVGDGLPEFSC
jgi:hypothetical protein